MKKNQLYLTLFLMCLFFTKAYSASPEFPHIVYGDSTVTYLFVMGSFKNSINIPDQMSIKVYDIKTKALVEELGLDSKGNYSLSLKKGSRYFVSYEAPGHFFDASFLSIPDDTVDRRYLQDYKVEEIKQGSINKKYMFSFNNGSSTLTNTSQLFLDLLAGFLKENKNVIFDLSINKSNDNDLNRKRISTVMKYMSKKGIYKSRMTLNLIKYNIPENNVLVTVLDKIFNTAFN